MVGDLLLVLALLGPLALRHLGDLPVTDTSRAFTAALVLPLLGRRRWPVGVFALMAGIAAGQWLLDVRAYGDAALLVGLHGIAVARPFAITLAAGAVLEVGVVVAAVRWGGDAWLRSFVGLSGLEVAAAVMGTSTRNRHALMASLRDRASRLEHERDQQGQIAAAAERARIAREMHDIVAHNLSVIIALSDGATYAMHDDPARAEHATRTASRTGRQALAEMRRLLGVLRGDADADEARAPQPGLSQIDVLVEEVRNAGLRITYEVVGRAPEDIPAGLQLVAYRVAQEALTNTLKHAGADATAHLSVRHGRDRLELEVLDSGAADRPEAVAEGQGGGLRGMRERAAVWDGQILAGPRTGGGWRVRLVAPLARPLVQA